MSEQRFDVVIPCFNPRDGWAEHLAERFTSLSENLANSHLNRVVVVNDGSTRDIRTEFEGLSSHDIDFQLIEHPKNLGKGAAIRTGLQRCDSAIILFTDVDVPYQLEDMAGMILAIESGETDLALGIRGDSYYASLSGFRRMVSKGLISLNKMLFRLKVGDTQGGLKVMNLKGKEAVLDTSIDRYLFDLEAVKIATKNGLRIKGMEVRLQPGIQLPSLGLNVLLQESGNLIKLLFKS